MSSVTVVEVNGDDDDEWGDEEEVVVWSNDLNGTHGNDNGAGLGGGDGDGGSSLNTHDDEGGRGGEDGHPRGLLIASLANLAISYNVVSLEAWKQPIRRSSTISGFARANAGGSNYSAPALFSFFNISMIDLIPDTIPGMIPGA